MKKLFTLFVILALPVSIDAQSPQKMSYQAMIRNGSDQLVTNQAIGMRISILQGSVTGTPVYVETQIPTTNANGLATIEIGSGTPVTGTFSSINWANGPYFLKTETDPAGGSSYTIIGTSQLLSVPYALYSKNSESIADNVVTSAKIVDGTIITADLAGNSVTSAKITDATVTAADLAASAITTEKINTGAVTGAKIAQAGATSGQVLKWDGTAWAPGNDLAGSSLWTQNGAKIYYNPGNVGIGISDPLEQLHVNGSVLLSTGDKKLLLFTQGTGEDIMSTNTLHLNNSNNQNVSIGEGGTSKLFVSGDVGIGTTSPSTKLDVNGVITAIGGNSTNWNTAYGWGNHAALYRPVTWVPAWSDITGKPTTLAGYGITDGMSTAHPANGITATNITNWNTAYGWGNHAGLYRPISWVPAWSDVTGKPTFATVATSGSYNDLSNKPSIINSQWTTLGSNIYYTTGNVGIGTSSPTAILHVKGTSPTNALLFLEPSEFNSTGDYSELRFGDVNHYVRAEYGNGMTFFDYDRFCFANASVGIGVTNPGYKLDVAGNLNIKNGGYGDALWCNGSQALWYDGTYFSWGYGGTYNYFADPITIGNVTNPTGYALWVQGNAYATGSWTSSDARYKKNISTLENSLDKVMKIRGTSFEFRTDEFKDYQFAEGHQFGFIAQELENVFPEVIRTESNGFKSVNYNGMIPVLLESIKEQQLQIESQQKQIDELKQIVLNFIQN